MRARDWRVTQWLAGAMARAGVSPNSISIAGSVLCAAAGAAMWITPFVAEGAERGLWLLIAAGVASRGLCNILDGMVAMTRGVASRVGELYNEVPDRVSDAAMLVG